MDVKDRTESATGVTSAAGTPGKTQTAGETSSPAAPATAARTNTPPTPTSIGGAAASAPQSSRTLTRTPEPAGSPSGDPPPSAGARSSEPTRADEVKEVRVLVDNLGPNRYRKGEVVDDPEIVALLDDGTNRVGRVEVC